jgi:hypothetical protein
MRLIITVFLALLLWGSASFAAGAAGIPKWIPAICLLIVGVVMQLVYARLVNSHFDTVGMADSVRVLLWDDRGVVPLWITITGMLARALIIAGFLPLLEAGGCILRSMGGV